MVIIDRDLPQDILAAFPDALRVQGGESLKRLDALGELAERVLDVRATPADARGSRRRLRGGRGGVSGQRAVAEGWGCGTCPPRCWRWWTRLMGQDRHEPLTGEESAGTFYPASKVCIVKEILHHLPPTQVEEGMAELIKSLSIGDADGVDAWTQGPGTRALVTGHQTRSWRCLSAPCRSSTTWSLKSHRDARHPHVARPRPHRRPRPRTRPGSIARARGGLGAGHVRGHQPRRLWAQARPPRPAAGPHSPPAQRHATAHHAAAL